MKIRSTVKVILESSDGDAVLTFRRLPMNDQLEFMAEAEANKEKPMHESLRRMFGFVLKNLVSVSGMESEDGQPITKDDLIALKLDIGTMQAIVLGYYTAINKGAEGVSPEKKDSPSAS